MIRRSVVVALIIIHVVYGGKAGVFRELRRIFFPGQPLLTKLEKSNQLERFYAIKTRNGSNSSTVWYHRGWLKNPSTGNILAGIEGIEFVKPCTNISLGYSTKKHFVYVNASNRSIVLTSFQAQRAAPKRRVNPGKAYSTIVNLDPNHTIQHDGDKTKGRCTITFPGGRSIFSKHLKAYDVPKKEFMVENTMVAEIPTLVKKWVSFGGNHAQIARSHEQYYAEENIQADESMRSSSYVPDHDAVIGYRRFGEGPSWIQPSRPLLIEINSYRLSNVSKAWADGTLDPICRDLRCNHPVGSNLEDLIPNVDFFHQFTQNWWLRASRRLKNIP